MVGTAAHLEFLEAPKTGWRLIEGTVRAGGARPSVVRLWESANAARLEAWGEGQLEVRLAFEDGVLYEQDHLSQIEIRRIGEPPGRARTDIVEPLLGPLFALQREAFRVLEVTPDRTVFVARHRGTDVQLVEVDSRGLPRRVHAQGAVQVYDDMRVTRDAPAPAGTLAVDPMWIVEMYRHLDPSELRVAVESLAPGASLPASVAGLPFDQAFEYVSPQRIEVSCRVAWRAGDAGVTLSFNTAGSPGTLEAMGRRLEIVGGDLSPNPMVMTTPPGLLEAALGEFASHGIRAAATGAMAKSTGFANWILEDTEPPAREVRRVRDDEPPKERKAGE